MEWRFRIGDRVKLRNEPEGHYPEDYFGTNFADRIHTIREQRSNNGGPVYFLEGYVLFVRETELVKIKKETERTTTCRLNRRKR